MSPNIGEKCQNKTTFFLGGKFKCFGAKKKNVFVCGSNNVEDNY